MKLINCKQILDYVSDQNCVAIFVSLKSVDENDGRKLAWLPRELPPNVKMIVSTLPDDHYECFKQLKRVIHPECFIEVRVKLNHYKIAGC